MKGLLNKIKSGIGFIKSCASKAVAVTVGFVALTSMSLAQDAAVKSVMDAMQKDAQANSSIILPVVMAIVGLIIGGVVAVSLLKKLGSKAS